MSQGDLFGELASKISDPMVGLRIKLRPCRCGCDAARIIKGQWLNVPFCCEGCGMERGRLSYATITFIRRTIELWGRPTSPIELRSGNYIATSSQPSGAGAETSSHAPAGLKGAQR
jgi:hypothetical protein